MFCQMVIWLYKLLECCQDLHNCVITVFRFEIKTDLVERVYYIIMFDRFVLERHLFCLGQQKMTNRFVPFTIYVAREIYEI